jgi:hypothetical protein
MPAMFSKGASGTFCPKYCKTLNSRKMKGGGRRGGGGGGGKSQINMRLIRFMHKFAASRKFKTSIDSNSLEAQRKFTNRPKLSPM